MFSCITVTSLALLWLFYESDWLRLRMLVGPVLTSCPWLAQSGLNLTRQDFGYEVESWKSIKTYMGPGITTPLCGWDWIEGTLHPKGDCEVTITAWGVTSTATFNNVEDAKLMKDYFTAALKPNKIQRKELTAHKAAVKRAHKAYSPVPAFAG